jgi:MFS family permease
MDGRELTEEQRENAIADLQRFTALNALSFEILAGQILILFARQIGASLTDIGLLSALLPFAAVIQLGVAPLVNRFGPRALMLAGWGARSAVSAGLLLVPLAAQSGQAAGTRALLVIMCGFYLCRALGMSSWLPLIQEIVRPQDRGMFLSRQEWLRQVSIVLVATVTALYLLGATGLERFQHIIIVGVLAASASMYFLWRVPDVGSLAEPLDRDYFHRAFAPLRDRTFLRYLLFSVSLRLVLSAFAPFLVVFLREGLHIPPSGVIAINTVGSMGAIVTLAVWGRWSDRYGARPVLGLCMAGLAVSILLWAVVGRGPEWRWLGAPAISLVVGLFMGGLIVSMSKFELGFIPMHGRAHYVALNVTAVGMGSGASTLAAGWMLQALSGVELRLGFAHLDRYGLFFLLLSALLLIPLRLRKSLPEERARSLRSLLRRALARRTHRARRIARGRT